MRGDALSSVSPKQADLRANTWGRRAGESKLASRPRMQSASGGELRHLGPKGDELAAPDEKTPQHAFTTTAAAAAAAVAAPQLPANAMERLTALVAGHKERKMLKCKEYICPYLPCSPALLCAMLDFAPVTADTVFADAGCGDGVVLRFVLEHSRARRVCGVDRERHRVRQL